MPVEGTTPRPTPSTGPIGPYADFQESATAVLQLLRRSVGLGLWLVTRTEGEDWIVLSAEDTKYGVEDGHVFRWSDSFCSRMVQGLGPRITADAARVPAYVEAPIGQQVAIGAYVGVPISRDDGSLFGMLCAIDPDPQPDSLEEHLPFVEVQARLLATILNAELDNQEIVRRAERAEASAEIDALTGLFNRRGWERLVQSEEERCKRYGNPAGIVLIDLDGLKATNDSEGHAAGDRLLALTAEVLKRTVRQTELVARSGGDEFAMLVPEESAVGLLQLEARLMEALEGAGVGASVGSASRDPRGTLGDAQRLADHRMYARKKSRSAPGSSAATPPLAPSGS